MISVSSFFKLANALLLISLRVGGNITSLTEFFSLMLEPLATLKEFFPIEVIPLSISMTFMPSLPVDESLLFHGAAPLSKLGISPFPFIVSLFFSIVYVNSLLFPNFPVSTAALSAANDVITKPFPLYPDTTIPAASAHAKIRFLILFFFRFIYSSSL